MSMSLALSICVLLTTGVLLMQLENRVHQKTQ